MGIQAIQPRCPVQSSLRGVRIQPPRTRWSTALGEIAQCLPHAARGAVPAFRGLPRGSEEVRFSSLSVAGARLMWIGLQGRSAGSAAERVYEEAFVGGRGGGDGYAEVQGDEAMNGGISRDWLC